jgi:methenyltetrahydromethanopterin cyclohydrolase
MDPPAGLELNQRALAVLAEAFREPGRLRVAIHAVEGGGRLVDAGVHAAGGIAAGILLARACLAGLGEVVLGDGDLPQPGTPRIEVHTDHPVGACMASQYAGWRIAAGDFFAMGSGPMRAAYGGEELFGTIGHREKPAAVAGILECAALPGPEVFSYIAGKARVAAEQVTLAVARTRSVAGSIQVVARSVETAIHKLHAVGFDLSRIAAGCGAAPLPPPAASDLAALGRTNDAVLYGGRVTLWVHGDDAALLEVGPRVPSRASADHGAPFAEIFERYGRDFYRIDPGLFSPAEITFHNLDSGKTHRFGGVDRAVLERSFFG